jgi:hypothetical protein
LDAVRITRDYADLAEETGDALSAEAWGDIADAAERQLRPRQPQFGLVERFDDDPGQVVIVLLVTLLVAALFVIPAVAMWLGTLELRRPRSRR